MESGETCSDSEEGIAPVSVRNNNNFSNWPHKDIFVCRLVAHSCSRKAVSGVIFN